MIEPGHERADRCPGLLTPHPAEDGLLVRVRVPGGRIRAGALAGLSDAAAEFGRPGLHLTSRANVQLRGVAGDRLDELGERIAGLGLLPSPAHERVRNIVASPLAGLDGRPPVGDLVTALDRAICSDPALAGLPGRFLFAVDDGSGDVSGLRFDLACRLIEEREGRQQAVVMIGTAGPPVGVTTTLHDAVPTMITIAHRFLDHRRRTGSTAWHLREVDPSELLPQAEPIEPIEQVTAGAPPLGPVAGAACVAVPLARLHPDQVDALCSIARDAAGVGDPVLVLTPWRSVVVPGAADRIVELGAAGLITDEASAWHGLTACAGAPGCARSAIDTEAIASALVPLLDGGRHGRIHLTGCERRCGRPAGDHVDLMAPADAVTAYRMITEQHATGREGR